MLKTYIYICYIKIPEFTDFKIMLSRLSWLRKISAILSIFFSFCPDKHLKIFFTENLMDIGGY